MRSEKINDKKRNITILRGKVICAIITKESAYVLNLIGNSNGCVLAEHFFSTRKEANVKAAYLIRYN